MIESQCRSPPTEGCWHQAFGSNRARSPAANGCCIPVASGLRHSFYLLADVMSRLSK
jgi:hypothetical protein